MHGDFSRWQAKVPKNQVGILAQEGRILLDADVNAQSLLGARWQDLAARAAFGAGVAAIPADNLDAWKVVAATFNQGTYSVSVMPGAAWADGLLVELDGTVGKPVNVTATPLGLPLQDPSTVTGAAGERDALVLDVWRRSLNGFQVPEQLIEPALGGPDTAERIETAYALRLYRMADGDTCRNLNLHDNLANHGHLTVTIAPTTMTAGDCPVVQGGGYTGLEHDLYRIEIADVAQGGPMFKWSQWNGGLVGRGTYDAAAKKLSLIAGDQAILRSGLTSFYFEALVFDAAAGSWRVVYGVPATLDTTGEIDLSQGAMFGAPPPATDSWFIRIWNDLRPISDFPSSGAKELRDGIRLEFNAGSPGRYIPGDYWTFPVRAGLDNPPTLLADAPPFGPHHHIVPLAELTWTGTGATIEDCRVPLHPITATDGCCTHSVGDGVTSHGDFTTVQGAIDALPNAGGRVCVLPGTYTENVVIQNRTNVELVGCGPRSRIIAKPNGGEDYSPAKPAIHVIDTSGIKIEKLYVEGGFQGIAILLEADGVAETPPLEDMRIADCTVVAGGGSGIEIRGGQRSEIVHNHVSIPDAVSDWALITVETTDARIERNIVTVELGSDATEYNALGGIWLRSDCTNIDVIDNQITGGAGHGVMLGNAIPPVVIFAVPNAAIAPVRLGFVLNGLKDATCVGCGPGPIVFPPPPSTTQNPPWVAGGPLTDIRIRDNEISEMGIAGVGVIGFFPDPSQGAISVSHLAITGNRIFDCVRRGTTEMDEGLITAGGYGAISLGDVLDLVIEDNDIIGNGSAGGPVCGIYVLAGSGVEISRNRIYGNGPARPLRFPNSYPHGGVWLTGLSSPSETGMNPSPHGRIAAAIRDNEIHAPNGPSLMMVGYGYFQIIANSLTSEGNQPALAGVISALIVSLSPRGGAFTMPPSFGGLKLGEVKVAERSIKATVAGKAVAVDKLTDADIAGAKITLGPEAVGIDAELITPPGGILFANNTVITAVSSSSAYLPVAILGLSDVAVLANQFDCKVPHSNTPVTVFGDTLRVEQNRCIDNSLALSLLTHGAYNVTTHNILDHCLSVTGTSMYVNQQNLEIYNGLCNPFNHLIGPIVGLGTKL